MKLTIIGGAGGTGRALIEAALEAGHDVTATARDSTKLDIRRPHFRAANADVLEPASLEGVIHGADAVACTIGAPGGNHPTRLYSTGVANILQAMGWAQVSRFIGVSALPVSPVEQVSFLERSLMFPIVRRFFGEAYADMARMEQLLRDSPAEWTVVRPPRLTNKPGTNRYRTSFDAHLSRAGTISRADLALAMVRLIDDPRAVRAAVVIAH